MPEVPISYPARYAPGVALNFADDGGAGFLAVVEAHPASDGALDHAIFRLHGEKVALRPDHAPGFGQT